jgi:hypothetical protein
MQSYDEHLKFVIYLFGLVLKSWNRIRINDRESRIRIWIRTNHSESTTLFSRNASVQQFSYEYILHLLKQKRSKRRLHLKA